MKNRTRNTVRFLVDVHVGTPMEWQEIGREAAEDALLAAADHYEVRERFPEEDTFEAFVTHVFDFALDFSISWKLSKTLTDQLNDKIEEAVIALLPGFAIFDAPYVWELQNEQPATFINGITMLRQGTSLKTMQSYDEHRRTLLPVPYRLFKNAA